MCYNCGCGMPENDMGKGKISKGGGSLTDDDFRQMAKAWNMDIAETKKNVYEMLKEQLGEKS